MYRYESLLSEVNQILSTFDETVMRLRHEKALISVRVKTAELRLVVFAFFCVPSFNPLYTPSILL